MNDFALEDRARTDPPDEISIAEQVRRDQAYLEEKEYQIIRVRERVIATMAGRIPACEVLYKRHMQMLNAQELFEAIVDGLDPDSVAKTWAGYYDRDAHSEAAIFVMEKTNEFCEETADHLAKLEIEQ